MKEVWTDIPGREGSYQVSTLGRIRSLDRVIVRGANIKQPRKGKILTGSVNPVTGYVCAGGIGLVHRIVALAFIPNPLNHPLVHHKDGNKKNNCVDNLMWATYSENAKFAVASGTVFNPNPKKAKTHQTLN